MHKYNWAAVNVESTKWVFPISSKGWDALYGTYFSRLSYRLKKSLTRVITDHISWCLAVLFLGMCSVTNLGKIANEFGFKQ